MARTATDANTQVCWTADNTTSPCANSGVGGTLDLATYVGSPTYGAAGVYTNCITYAANSGTGTVNTSVGESTTALTVSFWAYMNALVNYNCFLGKESYVRGSGWTAPHYAWAFTLDSVGSSNGYPRVHLATGTGVGTTSEVVAPGYKVPINRWNFHAFTYDGTNVRIYMNGFLVKTGAPGTTGAINYNGHGPYSSGCASPGYDYMNGKIDDIRIENIVRSTAYLRQLYVDTAIEYGTPHVGAVYNAVSYQQVPRRDRVAGGLTATSHQQVPRRDRPGLLDAVGSVAKPTKYRMRGYLYQENGFEEWVTTNLALGNPSGKPIRDIVMLAQWTD